MTAPKRIFRASAIVSFPKLDRYLADIVESIATHDMTVEGKNGRYEIMSPFGKASLLAEPQQLILTAEASDGSGLNRLKHALAGPIGFVAAREALQISWRGDETQPTLPDDLRILHLRHAEDISPRFRRITFSGKDLDRYDRQDQLHCRLIFQPRGATNPGWPLLDDNGHVVWPGDVKVPTRVYTIRHIDLEKQEITIDFALHDRPGPATRWAIDACPGDIVGILGPAGNGPKNAEFNVLAGDETALPGIARILRSLPASAVGHIMIEIGSQADQQDLTAPSGMTIKWLYRNGKSAGTTTLLEQAVRSISWPQDLQKAMFWGGCEHKAFSNIYRYLRKEIGLERDRVVFYSHWHRSLSEEEIITRGAEAYLPVGDVG